MTHTYGKRCSTKNCVSVNEVNTICYSKESKKCNSSKTWNYLQNPFNIDLLEISRAKAIKLTNKCFLETFMDTWSLSEINIAKLNCLQYMCICVYVYICIYVYIYTIFIHLFIFIIIVYFFINLFIFISIIFLFIYFYYYCFLFHSFIYSHYLLLFSYRFNHLFIYLYFLFISPSIFLLPSFSNFSQNTVSFNKQFILIISSTAKTSDDPKKQAGCWF